MSLSANRIVGAGAKDNRKAGDFYPTPKDVTAALINLICQFLPNGGVIWEPACGENDMADTIRERGYSVVATDILTGTDFLTAPVPDGTAWIITNPPFSLAEQFIRRAYQTELPFAFLLKSQFWHAAGRLPLFEECTPTVIAPLTWRPDFNFKSGKRGSPLMDVIWCIWFPRHTLSKYPQYVPLSKPKNI